MTRHDHQAQSAHKLDHIIQACNEAKLRAVIDAQEAEIAMLKRKLNIWKITWVLMFGPWLILLFK